MTFSHEDANARLLDLVYGEAAPAEREGLEAHVATCARCQQELAALGDTRARLRVALDDQPAPAGAHARILAAAAAEASNGAAGAATAPPAKGNEPASRAARATEEPSFWERMRAKWTFPTFATVGAVAVMLLGAKVFFDPQKSLERGREVGSFGQEPKPGEVVTAPSAPAPSPNAAAAPADEQANTEPPRRLPPREDGRLSPQARARIESVRQFGGPRHSVNDLLGDKPAFKADKLRGAPASRALEGLRPDGFGAGRGAGSLGGATSAAPAEVEKKPAKGGLDDLQEGAASTGSSRHYAPPPAGWKAGQSAGAAPAKPAPPPPQVPKSAPARAKKQTVDDSPLEGLGASGGGSSSRSASAPAVRAQEESADFEAERSLSKRKAAPAPEPAAPAAAAAPMARSENAAKAEAPPAADKKEKDATPSYQTLARRADELYAAGRWSEATAAYADLLRRFPSAEPAPRWRARLATAQREAAPAPAATKPAAKASKAAAAPASQ